MKNNDPIGNALSTNDRVMLFTQSLKPIRDFIIKNTGRWQVFVSPDFWDLKELSHKSFTEGNIVKGFKAGISYHDQEMGILKETSGQERLFFTQLPTRPILGEHTVKYHFKTPSFGQIGKTKVIYCQNRSEYIRTIDQLSIEDKKFSTETSGTKEDIHVVLKVLPYSGDTAIFHPKLTLERLAFLHGFKSIIRPHEDELWGEITYERAAKIIQCFHEAPESVLGASYIHVKSFLHTKIIEEILYFLERLGCVKKMTSDTATISIVEKRSGSSKDRLLAIIPVGEFKVKDFSKMIKINREDIFPLLFKYKDKIIYHYKPGINVELWKYIKFVSKDIFSAALVNLSKERALLENIKINGEKAFNDYLDDRIQRDCLNGKTATLISQGGVDTNINPAPSTFSI